MKIVLSEPTVVSVGPKTKEAGWGPYQFPNLARLDDGRIVYSFDICADSEAAYGSKPGCFLSEDAGKNWYEADIGPICGASGVPVGAGERLKAYRQRTLPLDTIHLPDPVGPTTWLGHTIYRLEEVECCEKTWHFIRSTADDPAGRDERVALNWPHGMIRSCRGVLVPPSPRGRIRQDPDGSLWMPHYYLAGMDPESGNYIPYLCNYLFRSTDRGHSWNLVNWLPYRPEEFIKSYPRAYEYEGFGENDLTFAPDGSMVRLIRTNGHYPDKGPCMLTRSADQGATWSKPVEFDDHGVYPTLLTLKCGVTLASYGRPGLSLRATEDPACLKWEDPLELIHSNGLRDTEPKSVINRATCSYTDMIALDERTAALAYSDFTVCDSDGEPHKTMMFRLIRVE